MKVSGQTKRPIHVPPKRQKSDKPGAAVRKDVGKDPPIMHAGIPDDMRKFVMNVWSTRVAKGWSQAQLDQKAQLGYARTSTIERGLKIDGITRKTIRQLAKALDVSEQWLLYGNAEDQSPKRLEETEGWFAAAHRAQETANEPLSDATLRMVGKVALPGAIQLSPKLIQELAQLLSTYLEKGAH